ncbi:hypothetical protein SAMN05216559_4146 [Halomicrobium zhouii]|uniref:Uncharacterized protein n=1 Tax=Halomicrobium zhouii TaxID=767519 RepID=A0A1I6MB89_9EURY|nr:hypothetical protein SAMN05216559_4146 [Halomicrobium zhouii]
MILVVAAGVGVSVLLFPALSGPPDPPTVSTADTPAIDQSVPDPYRGTKAEPAVVFQVSGGGDGLPIRIWNDGPTNRTVSLELHHNESGSAVVSHRETLRPNGTVLLEFHSPGFLLEVTDEATGTVGTYAVTADQFDCNERFATVRVAGNGSVDARSIAKTMGCPEWGAVVPASHDARPVPLGV